MISFLRLVGTALSIEWNRFVLRVLHPFIRGIAWAGWFLYFRSGWVRRWSKTYRWLYEERYERIGVKIPLSIDEVVGFVQSHLTWVPDGARELWDVFHSPQYVQWQGVYGTGKAGDCGAYAIWNCAAINNGVRRKTLREIDVLGAKILAVGWMEASGKLAAHYACLITRNPPDFDGLTYQYMDYGLPSVERPSPEVVVKDVVEMYASGGQCYGWAVLDADSLRLLEVHRGF